MRVFSSAVVSFLSLSSAVSAAASWTFEDATLTVSGKGAGVGGGVKEKYVLEVSGKLGHTLIYVSQALARQSSFQGHLIGRIRHPQDRSHNNREQVREAT